MAGGRAGVANLRGPGFLNSDPTELKAALAREARALGFDCIGVADPAATGDAATYFRAFIESGGHGESDRPIYGFRGMFVGRFQFMPRTVMAYVQQRDGRSLSFQEAKELAHDYDQAKELAKYMIFEQGRINYWPACSRKLGLVQQVAEIKSIQ